MAVVEHDARIVPFALLIYLLFALVGQIHGVVHAEFLPFFEFCGRVGLFPTFFIYELVFRTGNVRHFEIRVFDYVVKHAAIAAIR